MIKIFKPVKLHQYNINAYIGTEESRILKNKVIFTKIIDKDLRPIGIPIKASDFYSRPALKFLQERFKVNETKKE